MTASSSTTPSAEASSTDQAEVQAGSYEDLFNQALSRYQQGLPASELVPDFEALTQMAPRHSAGWTCLAWLQLLNDQPIAALRSAAEPHQALLAAERADAEGRAAERALVREQDDEYERSLAADRARERERRERQAREEAERREREEREKRAQEEAEKQERKRAAEAAAAAAAREAKRAALPEEPVPGSPHTAAVRVRLPTGANHQRRFDARRDTVATVYAWVDALEHAAAEHEKEVAAERGAADDEEHRLLTARLALERYVLVQAFPPRREFSRVVGQGGEQTLEEAGLAPQAALFVRLVDDDDEEE